MLKVCRCRYELLRHANEQEEAVGVVAVVFTVTLTGSLTVESEQTEIESTEAQQMAPRSLTVPRAHSVTSAMLPLWAPTL